jgi:hypothetical protein
MRRCSENYTKDCYILKLDIQGYFMSIHKDILYNQISSLLYNNIGQLTLPVDIEFLLHLIYLVIYNDPTRNAFFK